MAAAAAAAVGSIDSAAAAAAAGDGVTQADLFGKGEPKRTRKTSATDAVLAAWVAAWEQVYARKLVLPSAAGWNEVRGQVRRLRELIPDEDVRERFFAAYLRLSDPYIRNAEHPLRLALHGERYVRLRRMAERSAFERRLLEAGTGERPLAVVTTQTFGTRFVVALVDDGGEAVAERTITAATTAQAQTYGAGWLLQGPANARAVAVRPA